MNYISYLCLLKKITPRCSSMKQHFLTSRFLWVRNLGAAQLGPLAQVSHKAAVKTLAGVAVGSKLYLEGRIHFQEHSCCCWRIWFLLGCWTKSFYSLLAVGPVASLHFLPYEPLHNTAHSTAAGFHRSEQATKAYLERCNFPDVFLLYSTPQKQVCRSRSCLQGKNYPGA